MSNLYEKSGVSIDAGKKAVNLIKDAVNRTHGVSVLAGVGAFGGMFSLTEHISEMTAPTLVASTDGVGTKVKLASAMGQYRSIGHDIVNHCLNDIACAGEAVKPLFFLDYVASSKLEPTIIAELVTGMAEACEKVNCALLGGESAEMPGVYLPNEFDVVGTIVGIVDQTRPYPRPTLQAGNLLLGLPSSGAHTNGYSLIRSIFADTPLETHFDGIGHLGEALLEPHRCYLNELSELRAAGVSIQALDHITGGGLVENIPRAIPDGLTARINRQSWTVPPLFKQIQQQGQVDEMEMVRVFNMGIGMVVIIPAEMAEQALSVVEGTIIGEVITGDTMEWT